MKKYKIQEIKRPQPKTFVWHILNPKIVQGTHNYTLGWSHSNYQKCQNLKLPKDPGEHLGNLPDIQAFGKY